MSIFSPFSSFLSLEFYFVLLLEGEQNGWDSQIKKNYKVLFKKPYIYVHTPYMYLCVCMYMRVCVCERETDIKINAKVLHI